MFRFVTPPAAEPGLLSRRLLLGGAAAALLPAAGRAFPGAQPPALRPIVPPVVQAAIAASGLPATSFGLYVLPLRDAKPGVPLLPASNPRKSRLRALPPPWPQPLLMLNGDEPFQLASTTKLVTSLAALDLLGPQFRWQTQAFTTGPLHEGKLLGYLVIVGGGDARLNIDSLRGWFRQLQAQGLQEVWGDIVLDRFAFRLTETDYATTPTPSPERPHHARPDALMINEGVVHVAVNGSAARRADVSLSPGLAGMRVVNEVTAGKGCSAWAQVNRRDDGDSQLVVRGQWSAACGGREIGQFALPHAEFTTRAVAGLWRDSGGKLVGRVLDRRTPEAAAVPMVAGTDAAPLVPLSSLPSEPLAVLLREMNKHSDNLAARNLLLSLVPGFPQRSATLPAACARLQEWLAKQGLAKGDIEVDNGAGLSRAERGTPRAMVQLLRNGWHSKHAQLFFDSLPIAGVDGTLQMRMTTGVATGRAHLKTGTLNDTRALAGYVRADGGRMLALVAIVNDADASRAMPALDAIVEWAVSNG